MPVFRGHHLICLHFFHGEGYSEAFVSNLKDLIRRAEQEGVKITDGADDVCKACPYLKDNRCEYDEYAEDEVREMDQRALEILGLERDSIVPWDELRKRIPEIFSLWYPNYCHDCDWNRVCEKDDLYQRLKNFAGRF